MRPENCPSPAAFCHKLPPGFVFQPSEEECVERFLKGRMFNCSAGVALPELGFHQVDPSLITDSKKSGGKDGRKREELYFFSFVPPRSQQERGGGVRRSGNGSGYWKLVEMRKLQSPMGAELPLPATCAKFVYHEGKAPKGKGTQWCLEEMRYIDGNPDKLRADLTICHMYSLKVTDDADFRARSIVKRHQAHQQTLKMEQPRGEGSNPATPRAKPDIVMTDVSSTGSRHEPLPLSPHHTLDASSRRSKATSVQAEAGPPPTAVPDARHGSRSTAYSFVDPGPRIIAQPRAFGEMARGGLHGDLEARLAQLPCISQHRGDLGVKADRGAEAAQHTTRETVLEMAVPAPHPGLFAQRAGSRGKGDGNAATIARFPGLGHPHQQRKGSSKGPAHGAENGSNQERVVIKVKEEEEGGGESWQSYGGERLKMAQKAKQVRANANRLPPPSIEEQTLFEREGSPGKRSRSGELKRVDTQSSETKAAGKV
eukprot:TRINITY_DN9082_c0_g2_i1.p1 TRINITY_DN9082_c0_g2~~TRINITY_DN9082_c0_g2_i1.p1  ORF type:complete len:484 (-),score=96.32 TRINITY_DN9082_c0_g2_i1:81-1532(-)